MSNIGTAFPAQIFVAQAEVRLVAHQTAKVDPAVIKADERALADARQTATSQSADAQPMPSTPVDIIT